MTTTGTMTTPATGLSLDTPPGILWRSCDRILHVPMVEIPRDLAFDLIRALSVDDFLFTMPDEDLNKELHYTRFEAHQEHMKELVDMISIELTDSNIQPIAETMLRTLSLIYEGAGLVGKRSDQ